MKKSILIIFLALFINYHRCNPEIETVVITKTVEVPQPCPETKPVIQYIPRYYSITQYRYIEVPVKEIEEVTVEVLVKVPIIPQHFESLDELKAWLAGDDTDEYIHLFFDKYGVARPSDKYDCDDYALNLQENAAQDGHLISIALIYKNGAKHMINSAVIGNDFYYIEPQSDEVWFHTVLD